MLEKRSNMTTNDIKVIEVLNGRTYKVGFHCGELDITINRDDKGTLVQLNISSSISIPCFSQLDMIGKLITAAIQSGAKELELASNLSEMMCFNDAVKENGYSTCLDVIAYVLELDYTT